MAQQPNVELRPSDLPTEPLEPSPPRRGKPVRPGQIFAPADKPSGAGFGRPGPDTGYALRILAEAELAEDTPLLRRVLAALMGARAAHFGRAPTPEDLEVALLLAGLGRTRSELLDERRHRWLEEATHEKTPGDAAVAEAGDLLLQDPDHADLLLRR